MGWSKPSAIKSYVSNSPGATCDNAVRAKCRLVLQWSGVGGARSVSRETAWRWQRLALPNRIFLPWPTRRGASGKRRRRSTSPVNLRVAVNRCSWSIAIRRETPQPAWESPNAICASQPMRSWSASPVLTDRSAQPVVTDWISYRRMKHLASAMVELVSAERREWRLADALSQVVGYDWVVLDYPPSLGLLTLNALCAAHSVIVPLQCEYLALEGLARLKGTTGA